MQLWGAHAPTPLAAQRRLGARYDSAESLTTDNGLENPSYLRTPAVRESYTATRDARSGGHPLGPVLSSGGVTSLLRPGGPAIPPDPFPLLEPRAADRSRRPDVAAKVVVVSIDAPLGPLSVEERYREVLLVVKAGKSVIGEAYLRALPL